MIKLSIVIVAFRNMDCLRSCLESIPEVPWIETIVVDNTNHNRGFGAGCNRGADFASGKYLLFLNPDCVVSLNALETMVARMESDNSIGILGPQLTNTKGKAYLSCSLAPTKLTAPVVYSVLNRWFKHSQLVQNHWCGQAPPLQEKTVGIVSGAVMLIQKSVFEAVGGFDEGFFLYWEEVDLAKRIEALNKKILFFPTARVIHEGELSTLQPKPQILKWFRETRYLYFKKHFGIVYAVALETWLTLFEEWRLVLAIIALMSFVLYLNWVVVVGAIMMMVAFFNEVRVSQATIRVLLSFCVGLIFLGLGFSGVAFSIIGGISWIVLDLWLR